MTAPDAPSPDEVAFDKIEDQVWAKLRTGFLTTGEPLPHELFHYTAAPAFLSILDTKKMWATDCRALSDPMEGKYASELFEDVLDAPGGKSNTLDSLVAELRKRRSDRARPSHYFASRLFVASFSKFGDDLSQWRMYGDDGRGFSLCIRPDKVRLDNAEWVKVIYDRGRLGALLHTLLLFIASDTADYARGNRVSLESVLPHAVGVTERIVRKLAPFFKHESYGGEAEWRLARMLHYPYNSAIQLRASGTRLISYSAIPIVGADGRVPLSCSFMGPAQVQDWPTAFDALRRTGHDNMDGPGFAASQLPYRSKP